MNAARYPLWRCSGYSKYCHSARSIVSQTAENRKPAHKFDFYLPVRAEARMKFVFRQCLKLPAPQGGGSCPEPDHGQVLFCMPLSPSYSHGTVHSSKRAGFLLYSTIAEVDLSESNLVAIARPKNRKKSSGEDDYRASACTRSVTHMHRMHKLGLLPGPSTLPS